MIDWTISLGSVTTLFTILIAIVGFYWRSVYDSKTFKEDIREIKLDLKSLNKVVIDLAVQNQRLDIHSERINRLEIQLDELRHGDGFINART